jgi:hypothetical protein
LPRYANHFSRDCPEPRRERKAKAHLATADEEEPALLLAVTCGLTVITGSAPVTEHVMLNEEKSLARSNTRDGDCNSAWYLDTGASNHMSGRRDAFSELDTGVTGTVKFGDGSSVQICGIGTIVFTYRNGEHRTLTEVYFIPRLQSNIVSLGQLDAIDYEIRIHKGFLRMWDPDQKLMARVERSKGRLYVLHLELSQPVCLSARSDDMAWCWHARYGHLHFDALRKLARDDMVCGFPLIERIEQLCDGCLVGKQKRSPFPQ